MLKKLFFTITAVTLMGLSSTAQETVPLRTSKKSTSMRNVPGLSSKSQLIPVENFSGEIKDGRSTKFDVIVGKGSVGDDVLSKNKHRLSQKIPGRMPELVFDAATSNSQPTDPSLAIGPNHVFVVYNTGFIIYDKSGNALTTPMSPENIFSSGGCCDLTISYDNDADRWLLSYLYSSDGHVEVAVTSGPDPVNDSWNVYSYAGIQDYQKVSIWSDAYYMTANVNSSTASTSDAIFAMDRDAMLAGEPSAGIIGFPLPGVATNGFYSPQAFNISNNYFPDRGNAPIVYYQDDAFNGITQDHLKIWTVNVDFDTPANSTISMPTELPTAPFISVFDGGSFDNLEQPNGGTSIDAIQGTIMNQAQFRKFDDHNSAVFNFVIDTDGGADKLAGIRWYELRQSGDGQPWSIYQEGTYTSPDSKNAWMASMIMDGEGNIGMGYTAMGGTTDTFVSTYYTGRNANDPLNTMTIAETAIAGGAGNIPGIRYGDYGKIDVDPNNDQKLWFINEYIGNTGRADVVGVFQIAPNVANDVGVIDIDIEETGLFTANEEIKVTIFNFGIDAASNFDVTYQIDGGATITETFTGTIASATSAEFTFTQNADLSIEGQTYTILAATNQTGDGQVDNDEREVDVTKLFSNDLGVTEITSPVSGAGLATEAVTVSIRNFGGVDKSNFDVSYTVDGGTPVVETVAGPLAAGNTMTYTFNAQVNLSNLGDYEIVASSALVNDGNATNNSVTKTVANLSCKDFTNTTTQPIGPGSGVVTTSVISVVDNVIVSDVNVSLNLTHTFDGDLDIKLIAPDGTEVELSSDNGGSGDDYTDTVFDDSASDPITNGSAPFTGSFTPEESLSALNGLSAQGDWTLSITDDAGGDGGELLSWGVTICSAQLLSIGDILANDAAFTIYDRGNDQYDINLETSEINENLTLDVYNMLGQRLKSNTVKNEGGTYKYTLDMSYAQSGVYIIKLGNGKAGIAKRIIVK